MRNKTERPTLIAKINNYLYRHLEAKSCNMSIFHNYGQVEK